MLRDHKHCKWRTTFTSRHWNSHRRRWQKTLHVSDTTEKTLHGMQWHGRHIKLVIQFLRKKHAHTHVSVCQGSRGGCPPNRSEPLTWEQMFSSTPILGTCTCKATRHDGCSLVFLLSIILKRYIWASKSTRLKSHKKGKERETSICNNRQNEATARLALKMPSLLIPSPPGHMFIAAPEEEEKHPPSEMSLRRSFRAPWRQGHLSVCLQD